MNIYKSRHFPQEIIIQCVRWYVTYALSYRNIEEMMAERGVKVDHSTIQRWVVRYAPEYEKRFRLKNKLPVGKSWRMDETYLKVKGEWHYLYRAVDKNGDTVDFYFSKHRDSNSAEAFLRKAIGLHGLPEKVNVDGYEATQSGLKRVNQELSQSAQFLIRESKYLNNIIEQDHRSVKRITNQMRGFGSFEDAQATLAGIELIHMLKKGQAANLKSQIPWKQFYEIAA